MDIATGTVVYVVSVECGGSETETAGLRNQVPRENPLLVYCTSTVLRT